MKVLQFNFETALEFSEPVSEHDFVLRCLPRSSESQTVLDAQLLIMPNTSIAQQVDGFGNALQVGRLADPHDRMTFITSGMVVVAERSTMHDPAHPMYLRPSRYANGSEDITAFANDVLRVCRNADPWDKAMRLSRALHNSFVYDQGATNVYTTASEAFKLGHGVCQDYAHVFISLCRSQGIHARYVNGLILGVGATHAWVEVNDGHMWRGIDPTNDHPADDGYIALSRGRDWSDCPIESGVFRGYASQHQTVHVTVSD